MTDCRRCKHSEPSSLGMGQLNCKAGPVPVLTSWSRCLHGDCKPDARLFEPLPWHPEPIRGGQD
jgi:hypothetical protein